MQRVVNLCKLYICCIILLSGCYSLPLDSDYSGPDIRPESVQNYYLASSTYGTATEHISFSNNNYRIKKVSLQSAFGEIHFELYLQTTKSAQIVLVFPILKGKPLVESHFANYFVKHGLDAVIVNRNSDFLDPDNYENLEEVIQSNVMRDKLVMDYLTQNYQKNVFASFGISRGAINAAITAGADSRLRHNILVLGGTDIPKLFEKSDQRRIKNYVNNVINKNDISREDFFLNLTTNLKSDPKHLAAYIDARHTLLILGLFDKTVPIKYGRRLRKQLGNPKTIYLLADHYASFAFTNTACSLLPDSAESLCFFPLDFIESEALNFYQHSMNKPETNYKLIAYRLLNSPFEILGKWTEKIF